MGPTEWGASHDAKGYLSLEDVRVHNSDEQHYTAEGQEYELEEDEPSDPATLVRCLDNEFHFYTFHVVYNNSYKVPMLLFRGRCIDGQPLEWEDIEKDFPSYSRQLHKDSRWTFLTQEEHPYLNQPWYSLHPCGTSKWMGFLFSSRSEVRVPPAIMFGQSVGLSKIKLQRKDNGQPPPLVENSSVCSSSNNNIVASTYVVTLREVIVHQYLIAWLSVVGQAVGLKVPFEIAKFCS